MRNKKGRAYTEQLLSAVMEAGFDLKTLPVVMLGGGAAVVKGQVRPTDGLVPAVTPARDASIKSDLMLEVFASAASP